MWTDERLDDLSRRVDAGFDRLDHDVRELRRTLLQIGGGLIGTMALGFLTVLTAILAGS
jgi:hypothetical protein